MSYYEVGIVIIEFHKICSVKHVAIVYVISFDDLILISIIF